MCPMRAPRPWSAEHTGDRHGGCHHGVALQAILTQRVRASLGLLLPSGPLIGGRSGIRRSARSRSWRWAADRAHVVQRPFTIIDTAGRISYLMTLIRRFLPGLLLATLPGELAAQDAHGLSLIHI